MGHQEHSCTVSLGLQLHIKTIMPPKLYAALLCRKESLPVGTVIVELKTVISIYLQVPINNPAYYLIVLLINMKDNVYFLVYML